MQAPEKKLSDSTIYQDASGCRLLGWEIWIGSDPRRGGIRRAEHTEQGMTQRPRLSTLSNIQEIANSNQMNDFLMCTEQQRAKRSISALHFIPVKYT